MLKFTGAFLLFMAAVLIGAGKYNQMCSHRHTLEGIISSLRLMEGVLRSSHAPLEECFLKAGGIFLQTSELIKEGMSPAGAVQKTASMCLTLSDRDKDAFDRFASGLSAPDFEGQLLNIKAFTNELSNELEDAVQNIKTKGSLMLRGSFLVGAAIFILVI